MTDDLIVHEAQSGGALPAWSLPKHAEGEISLSDEWPERVDREWAWGGATGKGVNVCVLDSGVEDGHPLVGTLEGAVSVSLDKDENPIIEEDTAGDSCGHGTACAGIIRSIAPECNLYSVRVLGAGFTGSGHVLLAGLRYAVDQGFDLINMSLSTTKKQFATILHEIADNAYFRRSMLVASAHNMPVDSYPWKFSSVISVGSHEQEDPMAFFYNPNPPVEFFGRGVGVDVAWPGGSQIKASGNSFATPHIAGISALILSKHPEIIPFQLKTVLFLTASNVRGFQVTKAGEGELRAAVAAGVIGSRESFHGLLTGITEVARAIFGAMASSILLLDEETDELVFEAVAGYGEDELVGMRFPSDTGIAGWVLSTRTPLILDDVQNDPRFAKDFAAGTGYVPQGLMAVPLLYDERVLGVLEVLDRPQQSAFSLQEMELLGLFANQAAIALDLLSRAGQAEAVLNAGEGELAVVARLAAVVSGLEDDQREAGFRLLGELADTLGG